MDVFIVLSLAEPPLLHLPTLREKALPRFAPAATEHASGTIPAHLSVHAGAAAEVIADELPAVTVRYGCQLESFTQMNRVTARVKHSERTDAPSSRRIWWRDDAARARAQAARHQATGEYNILEFARRCFAATSCSSASPSARVPARGATITCRRNNSFLIMQDSTKHFTLHAVVDKDADMKAMFERTVAIPEVRDAHLRPCAEPAAADRYRDGRVFSPATRRAPGHTYRGSRHEPASATRSIFPGSSGDSAGVGGQGC